MKKEVELIRMSDIELQEVSWLWYPYIPFGKLTIIQGNPGEGKTTLALNLAAACSSGVMLPSGELHEPFNVIYQTAEDGLGDTVKPRLIAANANQDRIFNIDESGDSLSMLDDRIEKAIAQTEARLVILDPVQAYLGQSVDINRANEVRNILKRLSLTAEKTGCAAILVGHLNKNQGISSSYRGLGSIDFRAAARSVLLVGRLPSKPDVRVIVHDKSSLAPEGKSVAFSLGKENGFQWLDGYADVTADDLLGATNPDTKTGKAESLIREMLLDGAEVSASDIFEAAEAQGISRRTVNEAKKNIDGVTSFKNGKAWSWQLVQ